MLVLSRKQNESIVIDGNITITVVEIREDRVRLGIVCPREIPVHRQEVWEAVHGHLADSPLISYRPAADARGTDEQVQFVEISLGQLLAEVGAQGADVASEDGFTNEGGISPRL